MSDNSFSEGVKPGGLTTATEIRILLCYLLDNTSGPVLRQQIEEVLLGEALVNYFVLAESLALLLEQKLVTQDGDAYTITKAGHTVAQTLGHEVPKTVREAAVRGVIRAQQYAAKLASNHSQIRPTGNGYLVHCHIGDDAGTLFDMELYMPDALTASAARDTFVTHGDGIYKLLLSALTNDAALARQTLDEMAFPDDVR